MQAQAWPEKKKKIVLWTIVAVLGIAMGFFWIRGAAKNISKIGEGLGEIDIPQFNTANMPDINLNVTPSDQNITK